MWHYSKKVLAIIEYGSLKWPVKIPSTEEELSRGGSITAGDEGDVRCPKNHHGIKIPLGNIVKELPTTWKAKSRELSIKEAYEIIESLPEQIGMIKGAIREKFDKLVELDLWYGSLEKRLAAEKEFIALRESLSQKLYYHAITQPHECSLKS
jgi:hypothetical protein